MMPFAPPIFAATSALAAIGFTAPVWLWGATAVVLPILAHWRRRGRGRGVEVVFPAVRFLQAAAVEEAIRRQPSHWMLLFLRCLMILLAALAFAGPIFVAGAPFAFQPTADGSGRGRADAVAEVVIVVDGSASMQRIEGGLTLFDRARIEANRILDELEEAGRVSVGIVIAGNGSGDPLLREVGFRFAELRERLAAAEPAFGRADFASALGVAVVLTGAGAKGGDGDDAGDLEKERRVVVISDGQASEWDDFRGGFAGVRFSMVRVGSEAVGDDFNLSLEHATMTPLRPIVGESVRLSVEVVRDGPLEGIAAVGLIRVRVRLEVGGEAFERVVNDLAAGERRLISIPTAALEMPGWFPIRWSIEGEDRFGLDNELSAGLLVRAKREVGILTASGRGGFNDLEGLAKLKRVTNSEFLSAALMPTADSPVRVRMFSPTDLIELGVDGKADGWRGLDVLVIHEAGGLERDVLVALDQFVEAGGGILWVLDSVEAMDGWREFEELRHLESGGSVRAPEDALLPFVGREWLELEISEGSSGMALVRSADWFRSLNDRETHPLGGLNEEAVQALLAARTVAYVDGESSGTGRTVLEFENGAPAFLTGRLGRGRLGVLTFGLGPPHSGFMQQPMFVPFIHEVVRWLAPDTELVEQVEVGDSIRFVVNEEVESPEQLQIDPTWAEGTFELVLTERNSQGPLMSGDAKSGDYRGWIVRVPVAEEPGLVELREGNSGRILGLAGVQLDPLESRLRILTIAEEEAALLGLKIGEGGGREAGARNQTANGERGLNGAVGTRGFGEWMARLAAAGGGGPVELWPWCVFLLLLGAGLEHLFQLRLQRSTVTREPGRAGR